MSSHLPAKTSSNSQLATQADVATLPLWLQYLIGNYHDSWANERTFLVLELEFGNYRPDVMLEAVKGYCREQSKFPNIAALRPFVTRLAPLSPLEAHIEGMAHMGFDLISDDGRQLLFRAKDGRETIHYH